jgi:hypothetical protein
LESDRWRAEKKNTSWRGSGYQSEEGEEMMWQPIATAERCASKWLLVGMLDTLRFPQPTWQARFVGGYWEDEERRICAPTHWLPLPAPPGINGEDSGNTQPSD